MADFVNYIYESGISLGLFTLLYFLFLQRETFFRTNRLFLLYALLFSVLLPLLHLRVFEPQPVMLSEIPVTPYRNLLETVSVYGNSVSINIVRRISTSSYIIAFYLLGLVFFAFRLLLRLIQISRLIRQNKVIRENGMKLVLLDREVTPFSFLSYVFAERNLKEQKGWAKMLIHEFEHVKQGHSVDILILEVLTVLQWFNPFFWLLKRLLRENHEYLADRAVLEHEASSADYKKLLLQQFIGPQLALPNNFNYSLIKKRIQMMSQIQSSKLARIKLISGLLLAATLIIVFSLENKVSAEANTDESLNGKQTDVVLEAEMNRKKAIEEINPFPTFSTTFDTEYQFARIDVQHDSHSSSALSIVANQHQFKNDEVMGSPVKTASQQLLQPVKKIIIHVGNGSFALSPDSQEAINFFRNSPNYEVVSESEGELVLRAKKAVVERITSISSAEKQGRDNKKKFESDKTIDGDPIFFIVEDMPEFPGGEMALRKFIAENIQYPKEAQDKKIEGKVYVNFVVDKTGKVRNPRIARGVDPGIDAEALRVVSSLPNWQPGKQRGEPIAVSYTIPIKFALQ